jgi:hypothetical protein
MKIRSVASVIGVGWGAFSEVGASARIAEDLDFAGKPKF